MRLPLERRDILTGMLIYPAGDSLAAAYLGTFSVARLVGMLCLGATLYALEIPACYRWIDRRTPPDMAPGRRAMVRTALALLYFNPLWIARHLLFIALFSADADALRWSLLRTGWNSWLYSLPIAIAGNFVIQMKLRLRHRFLGSAVFSGVMALYYAVSGAHFR